MRSTFIRTFFLTAVVVLAALLVVGASFQFLVRGLFTRQTEKALIYLSVATHQNPSSIKYARALEEARRMNNASRLKRPTRRRGKGGTRTRLARTPPCR